MKEINGILGCSSRRVEYMHVLFQRSQQAVFPWHTDDVDLALSSCSVTAVINLTRAQSGVQIYGFEPFYFKGIGDVALFVGAATHRSVCLSSRSTGPDEVVKLVLFYD